MPTEDEIKRITELRDQGYSLGEIGEKLKKDKSTISRWFKSIGLDCNAVLQRCTTKKATEAKRTYDRERRLALNDLWFEKIEKMLLDAKDSKTLRELATPYGVAEDKRSILESDNVKAPEQSGTTQESPLLSYLKADTKNTFKDDIPVGSAKPQPEEDS